MNNYLVIILLLVCQNAIVQDKQSFLHFQINYQNVELELDKSYTNGNDKLKIENVQFYISNITFYKNGNLLDANIEKHFLINAEYDSTHIIDYSVKNNLAFDEVQFNIGIDSLTNMSGVYGGALDPTQGMYWTWQSGYINVKIEGSATNCPARKNKFQYHIGGYAYPNSALQTVSLKAKNASMININVDLDIFLSNIDISKTYEVMSPNADAVMLAKQFSNIFTVDAN